MDPDLRTSMRTNLRCQCAELSRFLLEKNFPSDLGHESCGQLWVVLSSSHCRLQMGDWTFYAQGVYPGGVCHLLRRNGMLLIMSPGDIMFMDCKRIGPIHSFALNDYQKLRIMYWAVVPTGSSVPPVLALRSVRL